MNPRILCAIGAWLAIAFAPTACGDLVLVPAGGPPCPIILSKAAAPDEAQAAEFLAKQLSAISGLPFKVQKGEESVPDNVILIGPTGDSRPTDLGEEGFEIKATQEWLTIVGTTPGGTFRGVLAFLEDHLGCRWWAANEETIPRLPTIRIPAISRRERPAFESYHLHNFEAQATANEFNLKSRPASPMASRAVEIPLFSLLGDHAKTHPEILPTSEKGVRAANNLHYCYSSPGIADALTDALSREIDARKGEVKDRIFFVTLGDWYGGVCQCKVCRKIYAEEASTNPDGKKSSGYSGALIRLMNRVGEALEKKHPGVRIGAQIGLSLEAPPAVTLPRANVSIQFLRFRHCAVHALEECDANRGAMLNLRQWAANAPGRVHIREYAANFSNFIHPLPCLRAIARNLKFYHGLGIRGVILQGNYASPGSDLVILKNQVWRKLLWDPSQKPETLIEEFVKGYYGPAAATMLEYLNAIEDAPRKPKAIHANEYDDPTARYLTPEVQAKLLEILTRAKAQVAAKAYAVFLKRVKEAGAGLEAVLLWRDEPVEERDGKLIRTDLKEYSVPRAEDLIAHSRNASPVEWSAPRLYQMQLLSFQGGPVSTLTDKDKTIEAKIASFRGGRIFRVSHTGKELIRESLERLKPGAAILYKTTKEEAAKSVVMEAEIVAPGWNVETRQLITKTVEMAADGSLQIQAAAKRLGSTDGFEKVGGEVETAYALPPDLSKIEVAIQTSPDQWQTVKLPAAGDETAFTATAGLRVTRIDLGLVVLDRYAGAVPTGGRIIFDKQAGVIKTIVTLGDSDVPKDESRKFLDRTISITPAAASAK